MSGYFFRCAVCNDNDKFVEEMKTMGIYVPDRYCNVEIFSICLQNNLKYLVSYKHSGVK